LDAREIYGRLERGRDDPLAWDALEALVRPWARAHLWGRGWHVVEEVVADTCESVVLDFDSARGAATFKGFVRAHYLSARRRALREQQRPEVSLAPDVDVPAPPLDLGTNDPVVTALIRCLELLPVRELRAVRLRHLEAMEYADVATELGVTAVNARKIVSVGMCKLRCCMAARPVE
jgi:RNA polymerase sigma factor (sigma-70 family)